MAINFYQLKCFVQHFFTATRKGHNVHSPFAYWLCEEVFYNAADYYDFERLKKIRRQLLNDSTELTIEDFGAGSKTFSGNKRRVRDIATVGISTERQSEILYRLVNLLKPKNVIELGTSVGLNTLYLAFANSDGNVVTIEGSKSLYEYSGRLASQQKAKNITFIHGKFDEQLPSVLNSSESLDVLYVDGNHTYAATLAYFQMALQKKNNTSVFVFDDIHWSPGMTRAWKEVIAHPSVTMSIDAFYFGFVFFRPEIKEKINLKLIL